MFLVPVLGWLMGRGREGGANRHRVVVDNGCSHRCRVDPPGRSGCGLEDLEGGVNWDSRLQHHTIT